MWKKYFRTGQATDDNMAHAICMQDTLRICKAHSFYFARMAVRTRLKLRYTYAVCLMLLSTRISFIHRIVTLLAVFLLVAFLNIRIVMQLFILSFSPVSPYTHRNADDGELSERT